MAKFRYKAKDISGNYVSGDVEATNESDALNEIIAKGYTPTEIKAGSNVPINFSFDFNSSYIPVECSVMDIW
jgi:type II secretory pathway component PulF